MHNGIELQGVVRQILEHLVIPLHYAALMGLQEVTAYVGTGAVLIYILMVAKVFLTPTGMPRS